MQTSTAPRRAMLFTAFILNSLVTFESRSRMLSALELDRRLLLGEKLPIRSSKTIHEYYTRFSWLLNLLLEIRTKSSSSEASSSEDRRCSIQSVHSRTKRPSVALYDLRVLRGYLNRPFRLKQVYSLIASNASQLS